MQLDYSPYSINQKVQFPLKQDISIMSCGQGNNNIMDHSIGFTRGNSLCNFLSRLVHQRDE